MEDLHQELLAGQGRDRGRSFGGMWDAGQRNDATISIYRLRHFTENTPHLATSISRVNRMSWYLQDIANALFIFVRGMEKKNSYHLPRHAIEGFRDQIVRTAHPPYVTGLNKCASCS